MQKHKYSKMGLFACVVALATSIQVHAMSLAEASGILADIGVAAAQASTDMAAAAGDLKALPAAQERNKSAKDAMGEGNAAYKRLEAGDDAAQDDLMAALGKAQGKSAQDSAPEPAVQDGEEYSLPNIHERPWETATRKRIGQGRSDIEEKYGASDFPEYQATPH